MANELTRMSCGECGIEFAMPEHFRAERQRNGGGWSCPNGHQRVYRETDAEKMRRERDRAIQDAARADEERRQAELRAAAAEAETRRLKKRASAGVCPCCNRSFVALARHMKTKHPEFERSVAVLKGGKA